MRAPGNRFELASGPVDRSTEFAIINFGAKSRGPLRANRAAMPKADYDAWPKVDEVAATIAFLVSPENRSGGIVPVYGRS
jgi:hypothetical protein